MKNPFKLLNKFDIILWCASVTAIALSFALSPLRDYFALASSLTGVTALMFVSKGSVLGQMITVVFALFYGVVSFFFGYYGEMITYLGLSAPSSVAAIISWLRHPFKDSAQVEVAAMTKKKWAFLLLFSAVVTVAFYFILRAVGTTNLIISTMSVTTSCFAAALNFMRSPLYGLAYAANDAVLIVMWILACVENIAYLPLVICFALFMIYDIYGFVNWSVMKKKQAGAEI